MNREYTVIVEQGEDGYLIGSVPGLPGCHTQGVPWANCFDHVKEVIKLVLEGACGIRCTWQPRLAVTYQ